MTYVNPKKRTCSCGKGNVSKRKHSGNTLMLPGYVGMSVSHSAQARLAAFGEPGQPALSTVHSARVIPAPPIFRNLGNLGKTTIALSYRFGKFGSTRANRKIVNCGRGAKTAPCAPSLRTTTSVNSTRNGICRLGSAAEKTSG